MPDGYDPDRHYDEVCAEQRDREDEYHEKVAERVRRLIQGREEE